MLFGNKGSKTERKFGLYDVFLFVTLIVKIVYVLTALKNRTDPNDRNQYIMILTQNIFTVLICFLLLYLFHPYSKHPTEVWQETKMFLFMYAILTLFEMDWNVFLSPMTAVLSNEEGVSHITDTLGSSTSNMESVAHKLLCNKDGAYREPRFDVPAVRDFCSHSQIESGTVATIIVVLMIIIFGFIHIRKPHGERYHGKIFFVFLATILFAIAIG